MLVLVRPVGRYLRRVFAGERTILDPALRPLERTIYRFAGVEPHEEMDWKQYTTAFLLFSFAGTLLPHPVRDLFFTSVTRAVLREAPVPVFVGA